MSHLVRAACAAIAAAFAYPDFAYAQSTPLPTIVVRADRSKPTKRAEGPRSTRSTPATVAPTQTQLVSQPGSLTVPSTEQARTEIQRTPGAVAVVPDTAFKNSPAQTIKDVLDWVPGVWAQPKWGDDTRLSIRGSGLSRNFHLRGIAALHGRHPDQHRRRLRRLSGDRSDRLSLCRGVQGRERAALRRQLARRRDQFRHADRARRAAVRRPRRRGQLRLSQGRRPASGGGVRPVRLFRHRLGAAAGRLPRSQRGPRRARQRATSATSSRRMPRRASTSTPTPCASAFPAR